MDCSYEMLTQGYTQLVDAIIGPPRATTSEEQGISSGEQPQQPAQQSYYEMLTQGYTQLVNATTREPTVRTS